MIIWIYQNTVGQCDKPTLSTNDEGYFIISDKAGLLVIMPYESVILHPCDDN